ncbi:MAG: tRNA (N6-isopentenyl adenosine(37)-C2)-methylthiotransferase MiaB [Treponema sp.]
MKYFIETYGCQMNFAESAAVEQLLSARGWEKAENIQSCDLLIVNTCSVRITAETRVFGRLGLFSAMKKKRNFILILMGCMAERLHDHIKKDFPQLDYVVGMFERDRFSAIFDAAEKKTVWKDWENRSVQADTDITDARLRYHFAECSYTAGAFQSFVPIMNGCNNFCTYCIVPYIRGREISRPLSDIVAEIRFLSSKGVREITLLGQNVNSYMGIDPQSGYSVSFPALLRRISAACAEADVIQWIRFLSSHPKDLSDELIEVMAEDDRICKSLHLPVQHGSDTILNRMNRRYTRADYLTLVNKLRKRIPDIVLTTDILVGFPGETPDDFQLTLDLMREVQFDSAFMYHYNPREGTKAYHFPDRIPDSERIHRLQQVIDLQMCITEQKMKKRLGNTVDILIESQSRDNPDELFGHTAQGEMAVLTEKCNPEHIGHFMKVQLQSIKGKTFRAVPIIKEDQK